MKPPAAGAARERILARVHRALAGREPGEHPGAAPAAGLRVGETEVSPAELFAQRFAAAGGEVVRLAGAPEAREWLASFAGGFAAAAVGHGVPPELRPPLPAVAPEEAPLGVSQALAAAADTGTVILGSGEGRRPQLLPPVHLVWVPRRGVAPTLGEALGALAGELPAALGLHSGPSKSADIGQVLVTGVHGPGRVVAVILDRDVDERD